VDSKTVSRAITSIIRPSLKAEGFDKFTTRSAWRIKGPAINVVNFQSFSSYLADGLDCTTFSFALNLGCHYTFLPHTGDDPTRLPEEYQCAFRSSLSKSISQPNFLRADIWFIESDGSNLQACIEDANAVIARVAMPWFARLGNLAEALRTTEDDDEEVQSPGTWGLGTKGSPSRRHVIRHLRAALRTEGRKVR
jgi:hypothetical protein